MNRKTLGKMFQDAVALHKAGNLAEAEKLYRQILQHAPHHADTLHMLGVLAHATGHLEPAIGLIRDAIRLAPSAAPFRNSLGKVFLEQEDTVKAKRAFQRALKADREFTPAMFNLGRLYKRAGELDKAEEWFRRAAEYRPDFAEAWNNLGNVLRERGEIEEAAACFAEVIRIKPELAEAHQNLAAIYQMQGKTEEAMAGFEEALRLQPDLAMAHQNVANLLQSEGRLKEASERLVHAAGLAPDNAGILHDAALNFHRMGDYAAAAQAYRAVLKADATHVSALYGLGQILHHTQRLVEPAEKCYRRILEIDPDFVKGHLALGQLLQEDAPAQAIACFEKVLEAEPGMSVASFSLIRLRAELCDWRQRDADVVAMPALVAAMSEPEPGESPLPPFQLNNFPIPPEWHRKAAEYQSRHIESITADARARCSFDYPQGAAGRLRIGYLSPDFRGHVVGRLIRELFRHHDRGQFEIFAYSLVDQHDDVRREIEAGCDHFIDISRTPPEAAARRINSDGIHILIDLGGYSTYTRAEIPALRPAPVQAHYLGYLDTMGAAFMPYVIADAVSISDELAAHFTEKPVYLPGAFVAATPMPISARPMTREEFGLPADAFVYCCFNFPVKISPEVFGVWMRILHRVEHSVLWLYDRGIEAIGENLRREAQAAGIDPARLIFAKHLPTDEYLARYRMADLFLDTFVYNAGGTMIGALQAGTPVLTMPGNTYLSRMGAAIAGAAGMPEMVCPNAEAYQERAIQLATDPAEITALREKLSTTVAHSPLFDMPRFVRHLEEAYRQMWAHHETGTPPEPIRVSLPDAPP